MSTTYDAAIIDKLITDARAALAEIRALKPTTSYMLGRYDALVPRIEPMADQLQAARTRIDELLATIVRLTNETPFPDELKGWDAQRAKMVAEVGSLRAERDELKRKLDEALGDGVLSQRVCDIENERDHWKAVAIRCEEDASRARDEVTRTSEIALENARRAQDQEAHAGILEFQRDAYHDELTRLRAERVSVRDTIQRYVKALDKWDIIRWEDTGVAKHNAAAELGDALTALKALVSR